MTSSVGYDSFFCFLFLLLQNKFSTWACGDLSHYVMLCFYVSHNSGVLAASVAVHLGKGLTHTLWDCWSHRDVLIGRSRSLAAKVRVGVWPCSWHMCTVHSLTPYYQHPHTRPPCLSLVRMAFWWRESFLYASVRWAPPALNTSSIYGQITDGVSGWRDAAGETTTTTTCLCRSVLVKDTQSAASGHCTPCDVTAPDSLSPNTLTPSPCWRHVHTNTVDTHTHTFLCPVSTLHRHNVYCSAWHLVLILTPALIWR